MSASSGPRIRAKLAATLVAVVLPLLLAEGLAIWSFRRSLRAAAEVELTNTVDHIYRLCEEESRPPAASPPCSQPAEAGLVRALVRRLKVGTTGYAYCMDTRGNLLVHPTKEGQNIYASEDSQGFRFIEAICRRALALGPAEVGTIRYPWKNEEAGETTPRLKILHFKYFRPWGWIIAAGSYEEEVYAAADAVRVYTAPLVLASIALVVALTAGMNRFITRPLDTVADAAARMASGDLRHRIPAPEGGDEFAGLSRSFNAMADKVLEMTQGMERLIDERTEALRESREQYRGLVEGTVDGIATTDLHGVITFANRGLEEMLGFTREELLGREIWRYYPKGKEQGRRIMELLRRDGSIVNYQMELIARDRVVPIRNSASMLFDRDGREHGTLGIFADVTAEKRLEADLRRSQAQLVHTAKLRALGDLVSGVAHEINNPLMASTAMLHVMETAECPDGCPNVKRLGVLARCNERIARIVNHLREFSRETELTLVDLDVNGPLENALVIVGQQLANLQIRVEKRLADDLPRVRGDGNYLEQVFLDVIANARDALETCDRERVLTVWSERAELDGRTAAAVCVADNGPGIPPEIRDKVFEPFFTTKGAGKGTGLGLSITYGTVEAHGGRIGFETSEEGTIFRIVLPALPDAA